MSFFMRIQAQSLIQMWTLCSADLECAVTRDFSWVIGRAVVRL